jgi:hypothetical protein
MSFCNACSVYAYQCRRHVPNEPMRISLFTHYSYFLVHNEIVRAKYIWGTYQNGVRSDMGGKIGQIRNFFQKLTAPLLFNFLVF